MKRLLNGFTLKIIAIVAMTLDHVAWLYLPLTTSSSQWLHLIGRTTAPIMAFLVAEGYYHTKDLSRYALRLGVFALLSHLPFTYFTTGKLTFAASTGVLFTIFLGLLALIIARHDSIHWIVKIFSIGVIFLLSLLGDWSYFMILWILVFGLFRDRREIALICHILIVMLVFIRSCWDLQMAMWRYCLYSVGGLLIIPLLLFYSGQPGKVRMKYFFYLYYPFHLILIRFLYDIGLGQ